MDRCVLIPAYVDALGDLARLIREVLRMSTDYSKVGIFTILTDVAEKDLFMHKYKQEMDALHVLTLDTLLNKWTYTNATLQSIVSHMNRKCWEPRRMISGVKKLLGLAELYHKFSCSCGWVLDSESIPLRMFSFERIFDTFTSHPRLLVTNMRHPLVKHSSRVVQLNRCAASGLNVSVNAGEYSYRTVDWWFFDLKEVHDMMLHVQSTHGKPFVHAYAQYPASDAIYYAMYNRYISNAKHTFVTIPDVLVENGLEPASKIENELSRSIWTCHKTPMWTFEQKQLILSNILPWVNGWRFDGLPTHGCGEDNHAGTLLNGSPSVLWATSNFRNQVNQIH